MTCATLRAKNNEASSTPAPTPSARLCVQTTVTTVTIITMLVVEGCTARFLNEAQEKVPMETMIITATSAAIGICLTHGPSTSSRASSTTPAVSVDKPGASAGFHVDDRLADHRAARHAAEQSGNDVGDALAARLAVFVAGGVGEVIDDLRGHQRFQQTHHRETDRVGEDDGQGFEVQRHLRPEENRQRVRQRCRGRPRGGRRVSSRWR
jgi:hypothetical protein